MKPSAQSNEAPKTASPPRGIASSVKRTPTGLPRRTSSSLGARIGPAVRSQQPQEANVRKLEGQGNTSKTTSESQAVARQATSSNAAGDPTSESAITSARQSQNDIQVEADKAAAVPEIGMMVNDSRMRDADAKTTSNSADVSNDAMKSGEVTTRNFDETSRGKTSIVEPVIQEQALSTPSKVDAAPEPSSFITSHEAITTDLGKEFMLCEVLLNCN